MGNEDPRLKYRCSMLFPLTFFFPFVGKEEPFFLLLAIILLCNSVHTELKMGGFTTNVLNCGGIGIRCTFLL